MKKTNIAIIGFGNVGRGVRKAIEKNEDMELGAIVTRDPARVEAEVSDVSIVDYNVLLGEEIPDELLEKTDVAILCGGSKKDLREQGPVVATLFHTVDSFDTHDDIPEYFEEMDRAAAEYGNVAIISVGWDPGTFSLERVLADAFIPGVKAYGFYGVCDDGGGLSMGHSDAIRTIPGVKDARQYTHAIHNAIKSVRSGSNPILEKGNMHWRECYVVLEEGANAIEVRDAIENMPVYFEPYTTEVHFVTQNDLDKLYSSTPHDGVVVAVGETGKGNKASIEYKCQWQSNPEATGSILVAHARAAYRLYRENKVGAFTILDIPPAYLSPRSGKELREHFM